MRNLQIFSRYESSLAFTSDAEVQNGIKDIHQDILHSIEKQFASDSAKGQVFQHRTEVTQVLRSGDNIDSFLNDRNKNLRTNTYRKQKVITPHPYTLLVAYIQVISHADISRATSEEAVETRTTIRTMHGEYRRIFNDNEEVRYVFLIMINCDSDSDSLSGITCFDASDEENAEFERESKTYSDMFLLPKFGQALVRDDNEWLFRAIKGINDLTSFGLIIPEFDYCLFVDQSTFVNTPKMIIHLRSSINLDPRQSRMIFLSSERSKEKNNKFSKLKRSPVYPMLFSRKAAVDFLPMIAKAHETKPSQKDKKGASPWSFDYVSGVAAASFIALIGNLGLDDDAFIVTEEQKFCNGYLVIYERADFCNPMMPNEFLLRDAVSSLDRKALTSLWKQHVSTQGSLESRLVSNHRDLNSNMIQRHQVEKLVTVILKHTSEYRSFYLTTLITSIRFYYPEIQIIVADDSPLESTHLAVNFDGVYNKIIYLSLNSGLGFGRNSLVERVATPYTLLIDDDIVFWENTKIEVFLRILEEFDLEKKYALIGGVYHDIEHNFELKKLNSYAMDFVIDRNSGLDMIYTANPTRNREYEFFHKKSEKTKELNDEKIFPHADDVYGCRDADTTHNFFLARTEALRRSPWRNDFLMSEHEIFFMDLKRNGYAVMECPKVSVLHDRQQYAATQKYRAKSKRFSSFCPAFKEMCSEYPMYNSILTPWHEANCELGFVCHIFGAEDRGKQLNTKDTDWRDDPIRRILCLEFTNSLCTFSADPEKAENAAKHSRLRYGRKVKWSERQIATKPEGFEKILW